MSLNPAFDELSAEAALIGRMVISFGEIELLFSLLAASALRDQDMGLRAIYRGRSTGGRIDLADVLTRPAILKAEFLPQYEEVLSALRHCLKIRNQYAHCHWSPGQDGLFFTNLEDAASRAEGFEFDQKHVDLKLLTEQESFFDHTRMLLLSLGAMFDFKTGKSNSPGSPKPPARQLPSLHNPAGQHVPHWLGEVGKQRHLERVRATEERARPRERPPSVPKLTEEEWLAKYRKEGRSPERGAE
jgi:hypothetical protein